MQEHVFEGLYQKIYEFCDQIRTARQIQKWLWDVFEIEQKEGQIQAILQYFIRRKLMVEENGKYLSLAVMSHESSENYQVMAKFAQAFA